MKKTIRKISLVLALITCVMSSTFTATASSYDSIATVDGEAVSENSVSLVTPTDAVGTVSVVQGEGVVFDSQITTENKTQPRKYLQFSNPLVFHADKDWKLEFEFTPESSTGQYGILSDSFSLVPSSDWGDTGAIDRGSFGLTWQKGRIALTRKMGSAATTITCSAVAANTSKTPVTTHVYTVAKKGDDVSLYIDNVYIGKFDTLVPINRVGFDLATYGSSVNYFKETFYPSGDNGYTKPQPKASYISVKHSNHVEPINGTLGYLKFWEDTTDITFDANGGTCATETISGYKSETITLPTATNGDYVLKGWSDGTNLYAAGSKYSVTEAKTLTAAWEIAENDANLSGDNVVTSLSLLDNININFKVVNNADNDVSAYTGWKLVVDDGKGHVTEVTDWHYDNDNGRIWCQLEVLAANINTAYSVHYEAKNELGQDVHGETFTFGVGIYCNAMKADPSSSNEFVALCNSIIAYGTAAANYLNSLS